MSRSHDVMTLALAREPYMIRLQIIIFIFYIIIMFSQYIIGVKSTVFIFICEAPSIDTRRV